MILFLILSEKGFDFALKLNNYAGEDIYDETYFKIILQEVSRKWVWSEELNSKQTVKTRIIDLDFQKCGYSGLKTDNETIEYLGLDKFYCPI